MSMIGFKRLLEPSPSPGILITRSKELGVDFVNAPKLKEKTWVLVSAIHYNDGSTLALEQMCFNVS